jgi:cyclopropane fatty-acyl-phospholipid synthase-like methyltransferase
MTIDCFPNLSIYSIRSSSLQVDAVSSVQLRHVVKKETTPRFFLKVDSVVKKFQDFTEP